VFGERTDRVVLASGRKAGVGFEGGVFEGEVLILRKVAGGEFEPLLHEGGGRLIMKDKEVTLQDTK